MSARTDQVLDEYDRPVPDASVYVYKQDGTDAILTSDGTTPLAQPVTTDEFGTYTYWTDDGVYREDIWFAGKLRYQSVIIVGSPSSLKGDPGSSGKGFATRALMAAHPATNLDDAGLNEPGREGTFIFSTANLSTQVTADPNQGIYVAPASDPTGASGAWVRKDWSVLDARWFGAKLDNVTNDGAAITAAVAFSFAMKVANEYGVGAGPAVKVPGIAYMGTTTLTLDHTFLLHGDSRGTASSYNHGFRWDDGATGIENPGLAAIEGLAFFGAFTGTEGEHHAIHATREFSYRDLAFYNWPGDGMNLDDSGGNNVNGVVGLNVFCQNCRNALQYVAGGDNNTGGHYNWNVVECREWGLKDRTFLGNSYYSWEVASCGTTSWNDGVNIGASVVAFGGHRYFAIAGQEAAASTNAPSGDTTDNTWWAYFDNGGVQPGFPAWFSGILVRAGGSYFSSEINLSSQFIGCYGETDQGFAQLTEGQIVLGGQMPVWRGSLGVALSTNAGLVCNQPYKLVGKIGTDETFTAQLGDNNGFDKTLISITGTTTFPIASRLRISGPDLIWDYGNFFTAYMITGPTTAQQFGTGAPFPHAFWPVNLVIGQFGSQRLMTNGAAAPTTGAHGAGEIVWNLTPTTGPAFWICSAAGTPGTWLPVSSGFGTTAIGYTTGAGGTVTQLTSKLTTVTLNTLCGEITMTADALAAGAAAIFALSNSQLGAHDCIVVNICGGAANTATYVASAAIIAAGSARIILRNMSGASLSEAVVIRFAIIKAVNA